MMIYIVYICIYNTRYMYDIYKIYCIYCVWCGIVLLMQAGKRSIVRAGRPGNGYCVWCGIVLQASVVLHGLAGLVMGIVYDVVLCCKQVWYCTGWPAW